MTGDGFRRSLDSFVSHTFFTGLIAMNRFLLGMMLLVLGVLTGCDASGTSGPPMKTGGGGMPQPYNPADGQYIK